MNAAPSGQQSRLLMIGLGAVVVAVVLGLVLVQRVGTTYRDGLDVAAESAQLAVDAAGPMGSMMENLEAFARAAETGIVDARDVLSSAQESLDQLGVAAQEDLAVTTEGLANLANRVAGALESVERLIPGNRASAAEDLRAIADGLGPVPGELRDLGTQLQVTAETLGAVDPTLVDVASSVRKLGDDLAALAPSVAELQTTAATLAERVDAARDRVGLDLWIARLVVIVLGAIGATGLLLASRRPAAAAV